MNRMLHNLQAAAMWLLDLGRTSQSSGEVTVEALPDDADDTQAATAEMWFPAGYVARPPAGSDNVGYAKALGWRNGDSIFVIGVHDPRQVAAVDEGEVAVFALDKTGSARSEIRLKPDGSISVTGDSVTVTADTVQLQGGAEPMLLGDTLVAWLQTHTHPTGTGPSGAPSEAANLDAGQNPRSTKNTLD